MGHRTDAEWAAKIDHINDPREALKVVAEVWDMLGDSYYNTITAAVYRAVIRCSQRSRTAGERPCGPVPKPVPKRPLRAQRRKAK